ncbi:hypothetical protein BDR03DRAFT_149253 [Suillus americanus]|nr:hypothetical protein BDR03DRAFT_149253 [Suillus americanus]
MTIWGSNSLATMMAPNASSIYFVLRSETICRIVVLFECERLTSIFLTVVLVLLTSTCSTLDGQALLMKPMFVDHAASVESRWSIQHAEEWQ